MECPCYASDLQPEQARAATTDGYRLIFNGARISRKELAKVCAIINSGGKITAVVY